MSPLSTSVAPGIGRSAGRLLAIASLLALLMTVLVPTALADNPGTVKVSGDQSQNDPNNQPHVPCQFSLEFFQFEADTVHVDFTAQQPSGDVQILTDTVALDPSGEEEPTFNGTKGYDFTGLFDDLERHAQQGYHVKVTVDEEPANPPAKHKVFWVDCPEPQPAGANLTVTKDVTGDAAPATGQFAFTLVCDGTTVSFTLADGESTTWADQSEAELAEGDQCTLEETDDQGATTVTVEFNGTEVDEGQTVTLAAAANGFAVTNDFPAEGGGGEDKVAADLLVDKVVTGDDAPGADTVFTIEVSCDGTDVMAMLADGDDPWSWNDDSGEASLTDESVCAVDETDARGADTVTVTFNGVASGEQTDQDLGEGDNTFVVTNDFPAEGDVGGEDKVAADLLVDKVVTGDDAPGADTVFTIQVSCDGTDVMAMLADGDDPWSWNDDSGEASLTDESVCAVDETDARGADTVTVTFNGVASGEQTDQDLGEGDNTFVVTNDFQPEEGVAGVDVEVPVHQPGVDASPDEVGAAPSDEQPAAAQDVADDQVTAEELPATGASTTALMLVALGLIGFGTLALRQADVRIRGR